MDKSQVIAGMKLKSTNTGITDTVKAVNGNKVIFSMHQANSGNYADVNIKVSDIVMFVRNGYYTVAE